MQLRKVTYGTQLSYIRVTGMRKLFAKLLPITAFTCFVGFFALAAAWPIMHEGKNAYTLEDHRYHELAMVKLDLVKQYDDSTKQRQINKQNQLAIASARVDITRYKLNAAAVQVCETARLFYWLGLFSGLGVIVSYRMTRTSQTRQDTEEAMEQSMVAVAC